MGKERELHKCTLEELQLCKEQLYRSIRDRKIDLKYIEKKEKQILNMRYEFEWMYNELKRFNDQREAKDDPSECREIKNQVNVLISLLQASRLDNESISKMNFDLRNEIEDIRIYKNVTMEYRYEKKKEKALKKHQKYLQKSSHYLTNQIGDNRAFFSDDAPSLAYPCFSSYYFLPSFHGVTSSSSYVSTQHNNEKIEMQKFIFSNSCEEEKKKLNFQEVNKSKIWKFNIPFFQNILSLLGNMKNLFGMK